MKKYEHIFILWHQVFKVRSCSCDPEVKEAQATNCRNLAPLFSKKKPQNFRWCDLKHCFTWSLHSSTSPIILIDFLTFFVEKVAAVRSSFHFGAWLSWSPSDVTLPAPLDVTPLYFKHWTVSPMFIWMMQMAQKHQHPRVLGQTHTLLISHTHMNTFYSYSSKTLESVSLRSVDCFAYLEA